jgi:hypothetical protein
MQHIKQLIQHNSESPPNKALRQLAKAAESTMCYSLHWMGVARVFIAGRRWGAVVCCGLLPPKAGATFATIYLHEELSYIPMSEM